MPRIPQYADVYACQDLLKEIRERQGSLNLMDVKALSAASGIPYQVLLRRIKKPDDLTIGELRKLCVSIQLDPLVVMKCFGYKASFVKKLLMEK